jgi:hypothetical protein
MSMTRRRRARPSPAIIVAVVALVAALAGTAVAANPTATSSAINKKKVKKIATKQINKAAPSLSVDNAAKLGGDPASAFLKEDGVRYARIESDGTIGAQVKGISQANVTQDGPGDYCFNGLNPAPKGVTATLDRGAGFNSQIYARIGDPAAGHCAGSQLAVETYNSTTTSTNQPFYIVIF